jgi:hypothetical protein
MSLGCGLEGSGGTKSKFTGKYLINGFSHKEEIDEFKPQGSDR